MIRFPSRLLIATLSLAWLVGCQSDEVKFADHLERRGNRGQRA